MIYIVEIPHQRPASCWAVHTEQQAVDAINKQAIRSGQMFDDFAEAIDYNGDDLSSQLVFMTDDEALAGWRDESNWQRHGGWAARDALRADLICHGLIDDDPDHV